ncbi:MAG: molybdopterin molybdotransferase MoeA [Bacteroidia bacterium]|nr:molybdopterin molybdotransferase MoeA [Bacteroidia bacterium]
MLDFSDALGLIIRAAKPPPPVDVPLKSAAGRVLAADVKSASPLPRFDASAVDGYALRAADTSAASEKGEVRLTVTDTISAGTGSHTARPGTALRIFTGAMMPKGADSVVMQEHVLRDGDAILLGKSVSPGANVRLKGEEFQKNALVFPKGTLVTPPVVGMLASLGKTELRVYDLPRVEVIVTGNELLEPGTPLSPGKIYDSNGVTISTALRALGLSSVRVHRVKDNLASIRRALRTALQRADIVVTAGGASVGDFDYIREACEAEGVRLKYQTLAIKPGKPNMFGTRDRVLFFGLPGNPVAALLSLHLLVQPAVCGLMGLPNRYTGGFSARLTCGIKKKAGRLEFLRGVLHADGNGTYVVTPVLAQDSHMLSGLAQADCLIHFPKDAGSLDEGESVTVTSLRWSLA